MPTTLHDNWHATHEHPRTNQDDKLLKAFVGIVFFVIIGFALAGLHPVAHSDSPDIQTHTFIRPAN